MQEMGEKGSRGRGGDVGDLRDLPFVISVFGPSCYSNIPNMWCSTGWHVGGATRT